MKKALAGLLAALVVTGCGGVFGPQDGAPVASPAAEQPVQAADQAATQPATGPIKGALAPEVVAKDVFTGETVRLSDLKGQVVLLNFWATWCGPCRVEMPHMEELHKESAGKVRIVALGGDSRESPEALAAFAKDRGLTFTVAHDGGAAIRAYKALGLPTTFFIDAAGLIRERVVGAMSLEQMRSIVQTVSQPAAAAAGQ
jgi:thiol-disulfide isomerase/thioredoxin